MSCMSELRILNLLDAADCLELRELNRKVESGQGMVYKSMSKFVWFNSLKNPK